ncbi:MAG: sulfatase-like hydrolase/transferase [Bryobacteraceae bacterium]|nr:sulfatase-like hydrolase/transferase [Bryobacteraceae bacterium]
MQRRTFLSLLGATAAQSAFSQRPSRPPNFVIVTCDDLGYGDVGCFGSRAIKTPRWDAFAASGMRFDHCYAAAPVCSPSRAGLLTGRTPDRCGVYNWIPDGNPMHLRRDETTAAALLRGAGYDTCVSGKWHLNGKFNDPAQPQPSDHGFEYWFATQNNAAPSHENPVNFVKNGAKTGEIKGFSSDIIVDESIRWLEGRAGSARPFFLYVPFHSPHEPVATADQYVRMYPEAKEKGEALYYGNVTQTDAAFGRLLDHLKKAGLEENTFVLFTSDNGPETLDRYPAAWRSHGSPGPFRSMKLSLYEGGIRVPGIARMPGLTAPGSALDQPFSGVDLLPTMCAMAGVAVPKAKTLDGVNMTAMLRNARMLRPGPLHWHYFNTIDAPIAAMRDGDWKVLGLYDRHGEGSGGAFDPARDMARIRGQKLERFELYNLRRDPHERNNLAAREKERLAAMSATLDRIHREVRTEGWDWRN